MIEPQTITTVLGLLVEPPATVRLDLPAFPRDRLRAIVEILERCDLMVRVTDQHPMSLQLILVGESTWSRVVGVHPEDPAGVVYLMKDTGEDIEQQAPLQPEVAVWINDVVYDGYRSARRALGWATYRNTRLRSF